MPAGLFPRYAAVLIALLAASSAPTPLYPLYQQQWKLSELTISVVFAVYPVGLLLALLLAGTLSDRYGRKPVTVIALIVQAVAMLLLAVASGPGLLIAARVVQGIATGVAIGAVGAALLDLEAPGRPGRGAVANSVAPPAGMALGVVAATALVYLRPENTVMIYLALAVLFIAGAAMLLTGPEPRLRPPGSMRPSAPATATATTGATQISSAPPRRQLRVPATARRELRILAAAMVAVWALGGFHSSLGPSLLLHIAPALPLAAGGLIFLAVTVTAVPVVLLTRAAPRAAVRVGSLAVPLAAVLTVAALHGGGPPALLGGAVLAGAAFGMVNQGSIRMVTAPVGERHRAAVVAVCSIVNYLAMSLPAVAVGAVARMSGLATATHVYAMGTVLLGLAASVVLALASRSIPNTEGH
ncbi:MFS transporter [Micromonospora inyonensis]|uniref:Predicted arabinose efflux permease, MFS family n=1 Tax=Micromonospora inyonensis TaxID=47866 RepID=A0A1C6S6S5_9ACTN|nr:MFS transporter [Micromonospora inyonensis]SCL24976.1 Predicted arabinose efflux permease, MFS family [Micromonospora inyonensis]